MNRARHYIPACLCLLLLGTALLGPRSLHAQPAATVRARIVQAAERFDIPPSLLLAVAYNESRWRWDEHDTGSTSCTGMPKSIGVMGLHDDEYFGRSLSAAESVGVDADSARSTLEGNIVAGAVHLSSLFDGDDRSDIGDWLPALSRYPGIPASQPALRQLYVDGVLELMRRGWETDDLSIAPVVVPTIDRASMLDELERLGIVAVNAEYPEATWSPSPNFSSRNGEPITAVTIHDTEGSFAGALSWLTSTQSQASAHYMIRSVDGFVVQMVKESEKAWHVRTENPYTIGIEHEGYVSKPEFFTPQMYQSSAKLTRYLIDKYDIPLDRSHVKGHLDFPNNTHTDPGGWWDWPGYFRLIAGDPAMRVVVDPLEDNVVGWWQPAQSGSTLFVDTMNSRFFIDSTTVHSGTYSGRLDYSWLRFAGGLLRVFRSGHGSVDDGLLYVGSKGKISMMVNGDSSRHELEIWLYDRERNNIIRPIGQINWRGWRRIEVPLAGIGGAPFRFHSIVMRQYSGSPRWGRLVFDEITHESGISGVLDDEQIRFEPTGSLVVRAGEPLPISIDRDRNWAVTDLLGRHVATIEPDVNMSLPILVPGVYLLSSNGAVRRMLVLP